MTVRIPIITVFDSKGLKQAQYQLNKVRGNFQNLGRNAAIAGAAIAGFGFALGKAVQAAAEQQKVYAQTDAVLKSTGTTANGSAQDIANLASKLQTLTAVGDDQIQAGANLLLTFKNIQNQAGAGNDIFNQTVAATLDVARAMGTSATGEAIRLGKALNDPIKGISALTRVGITFTDQQKEQIKALTESGDLLGAQKIILAELNSQFGGSAQTYAKTFAGQVELMNNELGDLSEEIGVMVMPALLELIQALRELAPEIGAKLKTAIAEVDWAGLAKSIVDITKFLVENAETIFKVITTMFILNTAYNAGRVAIGLYNAAAVILGNTFTVTAGKIGLATGALKFFRTALITTGIGALVVALGFVIEGATELDSTYRQTTPTVASFGTQVLKTGKDAEWAASRYGVATRAARDFGNALASMPKATGGSVMEDYAYNIQSGQPIPQVPAFEIPSFTPSQTGGGGGGASAGSSGGGLASIVNQAKQNGRVATKTLKLQNKGLSAEVAQWVTSAQKPIKAANQAIQRISKNGAKAVANLTKAYNKSAAGQAAAAAASAAADAAAASAAAELQRAQEEAARAEEARLAEQRRIYESFASSVANTFASIKNSIVGAFSLPELGGSTDSIIRNMDKLLARVKGFSQNITKLASMGLDPQLLQQVISAGPVAGARLAAGLVAGGTGALSRINAGFGEIGALGSQIATTGTESRFMTSAQQNIYNINVSGGVGSGATIGQAIVEAIKAYERTSGAVWQGA